MSTEEIGAELNQLARLLFDSAANYWYWGTGLALGAGLWATCLNVMALHGDEALAGAILGALLLLVSYALRLRSERLYDLAETMRRQSVLTEALDWPVAALQMRDWRQDAGRQIRAQVSANPRDPGYYATKEAAGPERLAEMTIESAFYTRSLYGRLSSWIWIALMVVLAMLAFVPLAVLTAAIPTSTDLLVARILCALIPLILTIDLVGWGLRLTRKVRAIRDIAEDIERLSGTEDMQLSHVMRLVSEYNCQLAKGIPVHRWLYDRWRAETSDLWSRK
jgi:hypothetical protein